MDKPKVKKCAEDFLPWAGWFSTPEYDPEVFARLPGWRQREGAYTRKSAQEGRTVTVAELRALQGIDENRLLWHIPAHVDLRALRSRFKDTQSLSEASAHVRTLVTNDTVMTHCTVFGEGRELLRVRPANGLYAYVWMIALFRKKVLTSLPVTIFQDLEDGLFEFTGKWVSSSADSIEITRLTTWLDSLVKNLVSQVS